MHKKQYNETLSHGQNMSINCGIDKISFNIPGFKGLSHEMDLVF
jgi:hypothetical protein